MKKKILFLYSRGGKIVTGGQVYEDMLFRGLQTNPGFIVERVWLNNISGKWSKYTAGIRNLRLIKKLKGYDMVFFNSVDSLSFLPLALVLRFLMGKKTVIVHHHFLHMQVEGLRRRFYRMQEIPFLRSAGIIAIPSPYILNLCRQRFPGKELRYWQIPFALPAGATVPAPQPGELLYIGTIENRKGLRYAIDALAILKRRNPGSHYRLTIVGKVVEQDYKTALDRAIASEGLDVRFTGFISPEEKQQLLEHADAFLFPSLLEGYGMVLCEAMLNGLPVICFDNSAMPYTITDGENGLLVPDRNSEALAGAIQRIVTDRALRTRLSAGATASTSALMTPEKFIILTNRETEEILASVSSCKHPTTEQ